MKEERTFLIGINAFVIRDNKILLGKRKGKVGNGTWELPGGHWNTMKECKEAIARELLE